ncbi:MAG TPA: response regulator [Planctomycetota bacterium]|nr:response regulator [Planctomycetota bacterium]
MQEAIRSRECPVPKVLMALGDEAATADTMMMLIEHGFGVAIAHTGEQCLDMLVHGKFGVLILDLVLPGLSGIEVLAEAHRRRLAAHIILVSRYIGLLDTRRYKQMGADDVLSKPPDPRAVLEICQRTCGGLAVSPGGISDAIR